MEGYIVINGQRYTERFAVYPARVNVTSGLGIVTDRVVLNGTAPFLLKALNRSVIAANADVTANRRFAFKFGNSDGGIFYTQLGLNQSNDRVVDTLMFGDGKMPGFIIPAIPYTANGSINYELEDLSNVVPYTVHLAFMGSILIPV